MALQTNVLSQLEKKAQFEAELQRYEEQADFLYRKQRLERIEYFAEQFEFLANEYPCPVFYEGLLYHSVYSAFQAARSSDEETRQRIAATSSVLEVFHIAQHTEDPKDWSRSRLRVMETLLRDKFRRNQELRERLRETNNYQLINTQTQASASNLFWGIYDGKGQNQLGRLLEELRLDLQNNEEIDKWLLMSFRVEKDKNLIPQLKLKVEKVKLDNKLFETIALNEKSYIYFGQEKKNDIFLAHPSVSRRQCVIFVNEIQSRYYRKMIETHPPLGTSINDQQIEAHFPYILVNDDKIRFAKSTRTYSIEMDYSECREYILRKIRQTEYRVHLLDKVQSGKASQEELRASMGLVLEDIVMVQDLPERVSHFELKQLFSTKGRKVTELKIPLDKSTGNTRNVAFLRFQNEKDAHYIIENERIMYKGQRLRLSLASQDRVDQFLQDLRWGMDTEVVKKEEEPKKVRARSSSSSSSSRRVRKHKKHNKDHRDREHKRSHKETKNHKNHKN